MQARRGQKLPVSAKGGLHLLLDGQIMGVDRHHRVAEFPRQPLGNMAPAFQRICPLGVGHCPAHIHHQPAGHHGFQPGAQAGQNLLGINRGAVQRGFVIGKPLGRRDVGQQVGVIGDQKGGGQGQGVLQGCCQKHCVIGIKEQRGIDRIRDRHGGLLGRDRGRLARGGSNAKEKPKAG